MDGDIRTDDNTGQAGQDPHPGGEAGPDQSRRRFAKSGLAVGSAVILSVASRSALAGYTYNNKGGYNKGGYGWTCKSPSGFQSGNVSQHGPGCTCQGKTPGYWKECYKNWQHPWPAGYSWGDCSNKNGYDYWKNWTGGTRVKDRFNCYGSCGRYGQYWQNGRLRYCSLEQVMLMGGHDDPCQLGGHLVAALLNAEMGWTDDVLGVQAVKDMWNEYDAKGYYEPTAGVQWGPEQIVEYLQSTMS